MRFPLVREIAIGLILLGTALAAGPQGAGIDLGGLLGHASTTFVAYRQAPDRSSYVPTAAHRGALPLCSGSRRSTCLVDGDTGWADGRKWRLAEIDAPEVFSPACAQEKRIGDRATRRLKDLMATGYVLSEGAPDIYGRTLVHITLADGRDAGRVLVQEGLAQPWPNHANPWCS